MTERLYYADSYCTRFRANVMELLSWKNRPAVVLDRTAFYPEGGGQPTDHGMLGGVPVTEVVVRESDGWIIHVLSKSPPFGEDAEVEGVIDWTRRFDHMQQHTGQHILSAAFEQLLGADTVGFHLGSEAVTVDIDIPRLEPSAVTPGEDLANQIVWEDRPIVVRTVEPEEAGTLAFRRPPTVEVPLRIVEIVGVSDEGGQGFDVNPCGGTHVARTGEVGLIKVVGLEHRGEETRVEFLCGGRAMRDYRAKNDVVARLGNLLTVGYWELDEAVERLLAEGKHLRRELRRAREQLLVAEADELATSALVRDPYRVVAKAWVQRSPDEVRALALELVQKRPGMIALLASITEQTYLIFARDADGEGPDMTSLLLEVCALLDGKGGGRAHLAQGGAQETDLERVQSVLVNLL